MTPLDELETTGAAALKTLPAPWAILAGTFFKLLVKALRYLEGKANERK